MSDPVVAQKGPFKVEVQADKTYAWCACGRSARQPFCDGSHKGTDHKPVLWKAPEDKTVFFCGCKHTGTRPMCDGTHGTL